MFRVPTDRVHAAALPRDVMQSIGVTEHCAHTRMWCSKLPSHASMHCLRESIASKRKPNVCALASQVGFRDYKAVLKTKVEERVNAIVNRLNGTKRDVPHPDLAGEREAYEKEVLHLPILLLYGV